MNDSTIERLLLADGWERVTGADLREGDYVAWCDDFDSWHEGLVIPSLDSKNPWWQEGHGGIKAFDVLLRRPAEFPHLDRRFDKDGVEYVNVSQSPRKPAYVQASMIDQHLLRLEDAYVSLGERAVSTKNLTKEKPENE
ncbi:hypothetical protein E4U03_09550 [Rothia nasimurium]|uniref:Uncharacterized protein n=1 Tax=Rothia nasimurium TaxID=85336 RepID=A0A4Y9F3A6_9MICC|nr:hypothetical protein [Rothia nasimurium]MBF0808844.1 hypothetical protein [Rothia nasimurium]TFU21290.1 hypothetical protein E4U03_09550 [Rothia nasimurium]